MSRAKFEVRLRPRPESAVWAGNVRAVEMYDCREHPHGIYVASMPMTAEAYSALAAELAGAAAVRSLHYPCHDPDSAGEACSRGRHDERVRGDRLDWWPVCVECGKPWQCPTVEVLAR